MDNFQTRIAINHVEGAAIALLYHREAFDLLSIQPNREDNSKFLEIGNEFEYEGTRYKIIRINFTLFNMVHKMRNKYGVNELSPTDPTDVNCQIGVFVDFS